MNNLVIGMGQIGVPLAALLSESWPTYTRDQEEPQGIPPDVDVLHVCYPWGRWFIVDTRGYADRYRPGLIVIHSTVVPGATDEVGRHVPCPVVYSPVRGRHGEMDADLRRYVKFVAGDERGVQMARGLLEGAGLTVRAFPSARALELAKLLETTYSGLLIAWAQEMARYARGVQTDYLDLIKFFAEVDYLPRYAFQPGHIGGHCIMCNLDLLEQQHRSPFLDAIRLSNEWTRTNGGERLRPIPISELVEWQS